MGIYDREYYRREGPSFLGAFTDRGKICRWLILINVVLYVTQLLTQPAVEEVANNPFAPVTVHQGESPVTEFLMLDTRAVLHGQVWRLLTYAFLHDPASLWHIFFNMAFLWWFGKDVEDLYGPKEFLAVYLGAALIGGLAYELAWLTQLGAGQYCLGASGAVTAILVLCACHYPSRTINLFFFLPIPIWLFVIFLVAEDSFAFLSRAHSQTAVTVHLGGAAFAFAYYKMHWRLLNLWPRFRTLQKQATRPKLRVYREDEVPHPAVVAGPEPEIVLEEQLEAKVDAVLEKVARHGQASLTETERQILFRASEVYKKKRT